MGKIVTLDNLRKVAGDRRPRVKICIPFYDSVALPAIRFTEHLQTFGIPGYRPILAKKPSTIIQFARNEMVEEPKGMEWDYIFFLDDDVGFEQEDMNTMVEVSDGLERVQLPLVLAYMKAILDHRMPICAGYYCARGGDNLPLVFQEIHANDKYVWRNILEPPEEGVYEVDAVATGFLCIKKSVFDAFEDDLNRKQAVVNKFRAWRKDNPDFDMPKPLREFLDISKPTVYPPFWLDYIEDPWDDKFNKVGEDIYFCREAKRLGFRIAVDFSIRLGHESKRFVTPDDYLAEIKDRVVPLQNKFMEDRGVVLPELKRLDVVGREVAHG